MTTHPLVLIREGRDRKKALSIWNDFNKWGHSVDGEVSLLIQTPALLYWTEPWLLSSFRIA
jgi:hypothetical protein